MDAHDAAGDEQICAAFCVRGGDTDQAVQRVDSMAAEANSAARYVDEFDDFGTSLGCFDAGFRLTHGDSWAATTFSVSLSCLWLRGVFELLEFWNQERVGRDLRFRSIQRAFVWLGDGFAPERWMWRIERKAVGSVARVTHHSREHFMVPVSNEHLLIKSQCTTDAHDKAVVCDGNGCAVIHERFA